MRLLHLEIIVQKLLIKLKKVMQFALLEKKQINKYYVKKKSVYSHRFF